MHATTAQFGYVQQRVARGQYVVDSKTVAAAILERLGALAVNRELRLGAGDRARQPQASGHPQA